jgi:hypothetical protein
MPLVSIPLATWSAVPRDASPCACTISKREPPRVTSGRWLSGIKPWNQALE